MSWLNILTTSLRCRSRLSASIRLSTSSRRQMSSNPLSFSFSPPLPSRYRIRHVTSADRSACVRIIAHAFMYHNAVDVVHHEPSAVYLPIASLVFDHCMNESPNLSFLLTDSQHTLPPATATTAVDTSHTVNHDADRDSLHDTDVVACILNYDAARSPDLQSLRSDPVHSQARLAVDFNLFNTLYQSDVRTNPPAAPSHTGHTIDCFYLAVKCDHGGTGLARYLCRALYSEARRLGYKELETAATHPSTAHIFMTQLGQEKGAVQGVVTHRLRPSELVVKREDGSEWRPWAALKDDVVCVQVPVEPEAAAGQASQSVNTSNV